MSEESICKYCGWNLENYSHDIESCKKQYTPIYLNAYQVGNLIGLFAMTAHSSMANGDWSGEIPIKLQQWCKENGFPMSNNFGQKIDSTTWEEHWSMWLDKILKSGNQQFKIESVQ